MTSTKMVKDSNAFLSGKWSSKRYAEEIVLNTKRTRYGFSQVASRPIPIRIIKAKLAKSIDPS